MRDSDSDSLQAAVDTDEGGQPGRQEGRKAARQIVAGNAASINRLAGKKVAPSTPSPPAPRCLSASA